MPGTCTRCTKSVFHAEETKALGKLWHTNCFSCANASCKKRLNSINVTDHEGEAFCKSCYAKLFGPKGYGYAMGSAGALTLSGPSNVTSNMTGTTNCNGTKKTYQYLLTINTYNSGIDKELVRCSADPSNSRFRSQSPSTRRIGQTSRNQLGGGDICGRCKKKVYHAEKVWGPGDNQPLHQACYNCNSCGKRLDSMTEQTYQGEMYCVSCYKKYHSPISKF